VRIDFDAAPTEPGWSSLSAADAELGDNWSRTLPGGIGIDVDAAGAISLDVRDRGTVNGSPESGMWRDFLFANGSTATDEGLDIQLTGLLPHTDYPITLWAYDTSSPGVRRCTWNGLPYAFDGVDAPASSLGGHQLHFTNTTDAAGSLLLAGRTAASPGPAHNVFINGMEIGDPVISFIDSDGDGLHDPWEIGYFTNITFAA
jgi:hypothetical protein